MSDQRIRELEDLCSELEEQIYQDTDICNELYQENQELKEWIKSCKATMCKLVEALEKADEALQWHEGRDLDIERLVDEAKEVLGDV